MSGVCRVGRDDQTDEQEAMEHLAEEINERHPPEELIEWEDDDDERD